MNKPIFFLALTVVLFSACKKAAQVTVIPEREPMADFLYLPTNDAVWKIHTQGGVRTDLWYPCAENSKGDFDTAWHFYYEITATGVDTMMQGKKYYRYIMNYSDHLSNCPSNKDQKYEYPVYYREDAIAKQILMYTGYIDEVVADFSDEQPGKKAKHVDFKPLAHISNQNEIVISNRKAKMWEMEYDHQPGIKYFYKAYGVGDEGSLLADVHVKETQVISIDFSYKGSNNHFDFPFFPEHKILGWSWN